MVINLLAEFERAS